MQGVVSVGKVSEEHFRAPQNGALLFSLSVMNGKQQSITLAIDSAFADSVNTHVASRLRFQPARLSPLRLPQHTPASNFRSTTPHFNYS